MFGFVGDPYFVCIFGGTKWLIGAGGGPYELCGWCDGYDCCGADEKPSVCLIWSKNDRLSSLLLCPWLITWW